MLFEILGGTAVNQVFETTQLVMSRTFEKLPGTVVLCIDYHELRQVSINRDDYLLTLLTFVVVLVRHYAELKKLFALFDVVVRWLWLGFKLLNTLLPAL